MAQPRRRFSKSRSRKRQGGEIYKARATTTNECSQCREPKRPHRVCSNCGYYNGKEVITPHEE